MAYPRRNGGHQLLGLSSREENTFEIPLKHINKPKKFPKYPRPTSCMQQVQQQNGPPKFGVEDDCQKSDVKPQQNLHNLVDEF